MLLIILFEMINLDHQLTDQRLHPSLRPRPHRCYTNTISQCYDKWQSGHTIDHNDCSWRYLGGLWETIRCATRVAAIMIKVSAGDSIKTILRTMSVWRNDRRDFFWRHCSLKPQERHQQTDMNCEPDFIAYDEGIWRERCHLIVVICPLVCHWSVLAALYDVTR